MRMGETTIVTRRSGYRKILMKSLNGKILGSNRDECDDGDDDAETKLAEDCPCERVTLELEDWSTCIIEEDHARSCGRGKQFRRRKCIVTATGQLAPLQ